MQAAKRAARAAELLPALELWASGGGAYQQGFYDLPCRLRVVYDAQKAGYSRTVETSHGASVSLIQAVSLLGQWQANTVEIGAKIGPYTVEAITPDLITIGCHKITRAEAERVIVPAASAR
jgi:hypothetical protein